MYCPLFNTRRFLATYDAYPSYIQRCDAARYFIIYTHGGLYPQAG